MKRTMPHATGDVFSADTDLAISLFAVMVFVFAFVVSQRNRVEEALELSRAEVEFLMAQSDEHEANSKNLGDLETDMEVLQAKLASLVSQLTDKDRSLSLRDSEIGGLKSSLKKIESELKRLRNQLTLSEKQLLDHQQRLAKTLLERDRLAAKLQTQENQTQETEKTKEELAAQLQNLKDSMGKRAQDVIELRRKLRGLETQLDDAKSKLTLATQRLNKAKADLSASEAKLSTSNAQLTKANADLALAKRNVEEANAKLAAALAKASRTQGELDDVVGQLVNAERAEGQLRQELVGIKGSMKRVVFVVDRSGSMKDDERWEEAKGLIESWLKHLSVENAALLVYNNHVLQYPRNGTLQAINASTRDGFIDALTTLKPEGTTNTMRALKVAYKYRPTTIILFSDGKPTDDEGNATSTEDVLNLVRSNRGVVVNTIGLGLYFDNEDTVRFLMNLAEITDGSYRAR